MEIGEVVMNISSAVQNNPALILLQGTLQPVSLATPAVQQLADFVNISDAVLQLSQALATAES